MKKLFLIFIFATFNLTTGVYGQNNIFDENEPQAGATATYKSGTVSMEINFDPAQIFSSNGGTIFSLIENGIKYRKFSTSDRAFRLNAGLMFVKQTDIIQEADPDNDIPLLKEFTTGYRISLMPGFEKHYHGGDNLSVYTGMQFLLAYGKYTQKTEVEDGDGVGRITKVNWDDDHKGALDIGAGFVTGVDYFIARNLYLGVEIGFGIRYSKFLDGKIVYEDGEEETFAQGNTFSIAPGLTTAALRLGWTF